MSQPVSTVGVRTLKPIEKNDLPLTFMFTCLNSTVGTDFYQCCTGFPLKCPNQLLINLVSLENLEICIIIHVNDFYKSKR